MWDAVTGHKILTLRAHPNCVFSVAFSPDGRRIASGDYGGTIKVWDATTGLEILSLRGHQACVHTLAFSPDGRRIASESLDGNIKVWDGAMSAEEEAASPFPPDAEPFLTATKRSLRGQLPGGKRACWS